MTDKDKISIYERYKSDKLSEEAIRMLLGDEFDMLQEDIEEFSAAAEDDTSQPSFEVGNALHDPR